MKCKNCNKELDKYDQETYKEYCLDCNYKIPHNFYGFVIFGLEAILFLITSPILIPIFLFGLLCKKIFDKLGFKL